jgi:hypothetical protein
MKICSTCNIEKEETKFAKKGKIRGYGGVCKECRNSKVREKEHIKVTVLEFKCWSCEITKSSSLFNKCKRNIQGITHICKECQSIKNKKLYEQNRDEIKTKTNAYYHKNKPKVRVSRRKRAKIRIKTDIKHKLIRRLRNRLYSALKETEWKKNTHFHEYIGCSLDELKLHIELQFKENMNWDNYGEWHLDHIYPLSLAQTEEELYKLCHYTNLQPLWAEDNLKKSNKIS